ncbi:MAG: hypothetical protein LUH47_09980 [Clostridiales bacterium]|nr:hypothetical protein [Clostridiales bacterium]MCD8159226.1 hypothetical protein [Clostridiales bacterium]
MGSDTISFLCVKISSAVVSSIAKTFSIISLSFSSMVPVSSPVVKSC